MGTGEGGAEETQPEGARAPGSPDKAAPTERRFSCPAHGGPRARTRHTRDQPLCSRRLWVRAAASSSPLRARLGPPRAFPQPAGRRAARNKGAAAAPAAPRPLNPARPARSPQPPLRPRATRPQPFDGKARTRAGTSGARPASPGAALTAAAPGRRGAVGELG